MQAREVLHYEARAAVHASHCAELAASDSEQGLAGILNKKQSGFYRCVQEGEEAMQYYRFPGALRRQRDNGSIIVILAQAWELHVARRGGMTLAAWAGTEAQIVQSPRAEALAAAKTGPAQIGLQAHRIADTNTAREGSGGSNEILNTNSKQTPPRQSQDTPRTHSKLTRIYPPGALRKARAPTCPRRGHRRPACSGGHGPPHPYPPGHGHCLLAHVA